MPNAVCLFTPSGECVWWGAVNDNRAASDDTQQSNDDEGHQQWESTAQDLSRIFQLAMSASRLLGNPGSFVSQQRPTICHPLLHAYDSYAEMAIPNTTLALATSKGDTTEGAKEHILGYSRMHLSGSSDLTSSVDTPTTVVPVDFFMGVIFSKKKESSSHSPNPACPQRAESVIKCCSLQMRSDAAATTASVINCHVKALAVPAVTSSSSLTTSTTATRGGRREAVAMLTIRAMAAFASSSEARAEGKGAGLEGDSAGLEELLRAFSLVDQRVKDPALFDTRAVLSERAAPGTTMTLSKRKKKGLGKRMLSALRGRFSAPAENGGGRRPPSGEAAETTGANPLAGPDGGGPNAAAFWDGPPTADMIPELRQHIRDYEADLSILLTGQQVPKRDSLSEALVAAFRGSFITKVIACESTASPTTSTTARTPSGAPSLCVVAMPRSFLEQLESCVPSASVAQTVQNITTVPLFVVSLIATPPTTKVPPTGTPDHLAAVVNEFISATLSDIGRVRA